MKYTNRGGLRDPLATILDFVSTKKKKNPLNSELEQDPVNPN